jgi:hypothetical protein
MNAFFTDLGHRYANAAASRGAVIPPPVLDPEVAAQLLELAGVVAHTQERRFAPLACYLAGVAAERLRNSRAGFPEAEVAAYVAEIRTGLESLSPPE